MKVKRVSILDGETYEMDLPIQQEDLDKYESHGGYIQDVFPNLPPEQREFIMSGITPEKWNAIFGGTE